MLQVKKCTIIVDDEVNTRLGGLRPEHLEALWNKFGIFVDGYYHMPAYQLRRWDGKVRFFDKTGKTYTKLLEEIIPYLVAWDYDVAIDDRRMPAPVIQDRISEDFFGTEGFSFRPYQVDVVNKLLAAGSGFAICATGAGKTSMCAALSAVLYANGLQTLVIVPSTDLVTQTADEFRERFEHLGISVGTYSGDEKNIDHPIVVGTWQSLQNAPHYMGFFKAVIVDEAHGVKATVIRELINEHGKHISHRYGVTGTFPKDGADQYTLKVSIGQILVEVPASWLIAQGYLSSVEIEPVETQDDMEDLPDYSSEKAFLTRNEDRLAGLATMIQNKQKAHGNTLVLVNSISQGQALQTMIPGSIFLYGETDKDTREENYKQYAERDDLIVIASFGIASTGISIDRIFCLILIDAGKSFVRSIQSVGRGLRKRGDKNHVYVVDVYSKMKFSKKHFKNRKTYYQEASYPVGKVVKLKYEVSTREDGLVF
jgi:superfamily II DNA or RNA helicase